MIQGTDTTVIATKADVTLRVHLPKGLLDADSFDKLLVRYAPKIAQEARDFWIAEAGRRLKSSKLRYQEAIVLELVSSKGFVVSLNDPLAAAIEVGAPGFDMLPGLAGKIVPMNLGKQNERSYTPTFRLAYPYSRGWKHPGWEPRNIRDAVITEVSEVIIPKYIQQIVMEMMI